MAFTSGPQVGINFTDVSTGAGQEAGQLMQSTNGTYIYAKAGEALIAGDLVDISADDVWTATKTTTTRVGAIPWKVGVALGTVASGSYAWFFSAGPGQVSVSVANGIAAGVKLTTTGTAGVAGTGGTVLGGLVTVGNTSGGAAVITCFATGNLHCNP